MLYFFIWCLAAHGDIARLQDKLAEAHNTLSDQRSHILSLVSQNDKLKIAELADRKKIRFLLAATAGENEPETTYFKKALSSKSRLCITLT